MGHSMAPIRYESRGGWKELQSIITSGMIAHFSSILSDSEQKHIRIIYNKEQLPSFGNIKSVAAYMMFNT